MAGFSFIRFVAPVFLLAAILVFPGSADAAAPQRERILLYDVTAVFESTGIMEVTEKITVLAAGQQIRRGIFRTFPTIWDRQDGKRFMLDVSVKEVLRNGEREPFSLNESNDTLKIYIGRKGVMVPHGQHEYTIRYTVQNHFSRFPDWDELYWNVTGNAWAFSIDKARFRLFFRESPGAPLQPMPVRSIDVYTGRVNEKGKNARVNKDNSIETTRILGRGHGLTVAWTWPRYLLQNAPDPIAYSLVKKMFLPRGKSFILWIIPLILAGYFLFGHRRRKTGPMPEVIPLFKVPEGLTPGELRYAVKRSYDGTAFAADLLNLVPKGLAELKEESGNPVLVEIEDAELPDSMEEKIAIDLFASCSSMAITKHNRAALEDTRRFVATEVAKEKKVLFWPWVLAVVLGYVLLFAVPVVSGVFFDLESAVFFGAIFVFVSFLGAVFFILCATTRGSFTSIAGVFGAFPQLVAIVAIFLVLCAMCFSLLPVVFIQAELPDGFSGAFLASLLIWVVGSITLPKRKDEGKRRLAIAKGLAMYLGTAERDRFAELYPPEESVEHFEVLLPYALALDAGKTWANRFEKYLATAGRTSQAFGDASWRSVQSFRTSAISSSYTPSTSVGSGGSFSGSGSSGGGSSGRGSGGGGGGGW